MLLVATSVAAPAATTTVSLSPAVAEIDPRTRAPEPPEAFALDPPAEPITVTGSDSTPAGQTQVYVPGSVLLKPKHDSSAATAAATGITASDATESALVRVTANAVLIERERRCNLIEITLLLQNDRVMVRLTLEYYKFDL